MFRLLGSVKDSSSNNSRNSERTNQFKSNHNKRKKEGKKISELGL